jgi:hypothetical protein
VGTGALRDIQPAPTWNLVEDLPNVYKVTRKENDYRWHWQQSMPETPMLTSST